MAVQLPPNSGPCQSSRVNTYHWTELKIYQNLPDVVFYVAGVLACFGQRDLIATMPDRLDVLTGSCVQIPCSFDIPDQHKNTFNSTILTSEVWIKENPYFDVHPDNVIFNSSKTVNRYQGKITGNMSQKNCTTVFFNVTTNYTNTYYFRIESQPFRATDIGKSVDIVVRDWPSSPNLTVSGELKEGNPVSLNCSAVAPCPEHPPELTWTLPTQFTTEKQLQENPDQTKSVLSTVTFTLSYLHHEKNITCTAVYPVGASNKTAERNMMLNVSFSPKDTSASISPADPVLVGSCVNLTCSSTANPPVTNFTWFQISKGQEEPVNPKVFEIVRKTLGLLFLFSLIVFFAWRRRTSRLPSGFDMTDSSQGQNSPVGTVCFNQATVGRGNQ
nr:unnamed protein product [Salmo salar]|eukprot:XP_014015190.1 PREDICTED: sialic acid-binding Ig-like lectin 6 isoform X3 [Salmo salar]